MNPYHDFLAVKVQPLPLVPGGELWVAPLGQWAREAAECMIADRHPPTTTRRFLARLATDAMLGRLHDTSHRGARLLRLAVESRIRPDDHFKAETFVGIVQREVERVLSREAAR